MTIPGRKAIHAFVRGRVQGVGFRYSAIREARSRGLRGMVRNRADGSVEVVAEGAGDSIDGFLEWLHRGPPGSWVRDVQALEIPWTGHYEDFDVEF